VNSKGPSSDHSNAARNQEATRRRQKAANYAERYEPEIGTPSADAIRYCNAPVSSVAKVKSSITV
jgi:hypothetical protein